MSLGGRRGARDGTRAGLRGDRSGESRSGCSHYRGARAYLDMLKLLLSLSLPSDIKRGVQRSPTNSRLRWRGKRASRANLSVAYRRVRGKFGLGDDAGTHAMCPVADATRLFARDVRNARVAGDAAGVTNLGGPVAQVTKPPFSNRRRFFPTVILGRKYNRVASRRLPTSGASDPRPWRQRRP